MTPREFVGEVVRPNVVTFHEQFASLRHAFNAVAAVDALAAHLYRWCMVNAPAEIANETDDTTYRGTLARRFPDFGLLRDIAKVQKHVSLMRGTPQVTQEHQVDVRSIGYGQGGYGGGRNGGPPQVVVDTNAGDFEYVEHVVDNALAVLEGEMRRLNV